MVAKMCDIGNGNVQEPNHDIVPLLVDFEGNENPKCHHDARDSKGSAGKDERLGRLVRKVGRVSEKGRVDVVEVVVQHQQYVREVVGSLEVADKSRIKKDHRILQILGDSKIILKVNIDTDVSLKGDMVIAVVIDKTGKVISPIKSGKDVRGKK